MFWLLTPVLVAINQLEMSHQQPVLIAQTWLQFPPISHPKYQVYVTRNVAGTCPKVSLTYSVVSRLQTQSPIALLEVKEAMGKYHNEVWAALYETKCHCKHHSKTIRPRFLVYRAKPLVPLPVRSVFFFLFLLLNGWASLCRMMCVQSLTLNSHFHIHCADWKAHFKRWAYINNSMEASPGLLHLVETGVMWKVEVSTHRCGMDFTVKQDTSCFEQLNVWN